MKTIGQGTGIKAAAILLAFTGSGAAQEPVVPQTHPAEITIYQKGTQPYKQIERLADYPRSHGAQEGKNYFTTLPNGYFLHFANNDNDPTISQGDRLRILPPRGHVADEQAAEYVERLPNVSKGPDGWYIGSFNTEVDKELSALLSLSPADHERLSSLAMERGALLWRQLSATAAKELDNIERERYGFTREDLITAIKTAAGTPHFTAQDIRQYRLNFQHEGRNYAVLLSEFDDGDSLDVAEVDPRAKHGTFLTHRGHGHYALQVFSGYYGGSEFPINLERFTKMSADPSWTPPFESIFNEDYFGEDYKRIGEAIRTDTSSPQIRPSLEEDN